MKQQTLEHLVDKKRAARKQIADDTLQVIERGSYLSHDISAAIASSKQNTRYYAPASLLSTWSSPTQSGSPPPYSPHHTSVSLLEISTLEGARLLANMNAVASTSTTKIGVLNFASAKKAGGGFLSGAQAQEESIARSSTLYPTLMTGVAQAFYTLHNRDQKGGYYSHAMIYSPGVLVIRDDVGGWVEPLKIDVLTCAAVNAGVVRQQPGKKVLNTSGGGATEESKIERVMKERMGRILFLFESQGVKNLVLGSFGTGVFQNSVGVVAQIWADLLLIDGARFQNSFDNVVFAVLGKDSFETFKLVFGPYNLRSSDE